MELLKFKKSDTNVSVSSTLSFGSFLTLWHCKNIVETACWHSNHCWEQHLRLIHFNRRRNSRNNLTLSIRMGSVLILLRTPKHAS